MKPKETDQRLKAYVLGVLARVATTVRFDFVVKDWTVAWRVAPHAFGSVASAIRPDMICVRKLAEFPNAQEAGAAYDGYNDIMYVDEASPDKTGPEEILADSRVVHESIHAFFDVYACQQLTRATGEAASYIVQAAYLESIGQTNPPTMGGTYPIILREAFSMLNRARKGETLTRVELGPLRAAVVKHYKGLFGAKYQGEVNLKLGLGV
jgi:hypothetical protein